MNYFFPTILMDRISENREYVAVFENPAHEQDSEPSAMPIDRHLKVVPIDRHLTVVPIDRLKQINQNLFVKKQTNIFWSFVRLGSVVTYAVGAVYFYRSSSGKLYNAHPPFAVVSLIGTGASRWTSNSNRNNQGNVRGAVNSTPVQPNSNQYTQQGAGSSHGGFGGSALRKSTTCVTKADSNTVQVRKNVKVRASIIGMDRFDPNRQGVVTAFDSTTVDFYLKTHDSTPFTVVLLSENKEAKKKVLLTQWFLQFEPAKNDYESPTFIDVMSVNGGSAIDELQANTALGEVTDFCCQPINTNTNFSFCDLNNSREMYTNIPISYGQTKGNLERDAALHVASLVSHFNDVRDTQITNLCLTIPKTRLLNEVKPKTLFSMLNPKNPENQGVINHQSKTIKLADLASALKSHSVYSTRPSSTLGDMGLTLSKILKINPDNYEAAHFASVRVLKNLEGNHETSTSIWQHKISNGLGGHDSPAAQAHDMGATCLASVFTNNAYIGHNQICKKILETTVSGKLENGVGLLLSEKCNFKALQETRARVARWHEEELEQDIQVEVSEKSLPPQLANDYYSRLAVYRYWADCALTSFDIATNKVKMAEEIYNTRYAKNATKQYEKVHPTTKLATQTSVLELGYARKAYKAAIKGLAIATAFHSLVHTHSYDRAQEFFRYTFARCMNSLGTEGPLFLSEAKESLFLSKADKNFIKTQQNKFYYVKARFTTLTNAAKTSKELLERLLSQATPEVKEGLTEALIKLQIEIEANYSLLERWSKQDQPELYTLDTVFSAYEDLLSYRFDYSDDVLDKNPEAWTKFSNKLNTGFSNQFVWKANKQANLVLSSAVHMNTIVNREEQFSQKGYSKFGDEVKLLKKQHEKASAKAKKAQDTSAAAEARRNKAIQALETAQQDLETAQQNLANQTESTESTVSKIYKKAKTSVASKKASFEKQDKKFRDAFQNLHNLNKYVDNLEQNILELLGKGLEHNEYTDNEYFINFYKLLFENSSAQSDSSDSGKLLALRYAELTAELTAVDGKPCIQEDVKPRAYSAPEVKNRSYADAVKPRAYSVPEVKKRSYADAVQQGSGRSGRSASSPASTYFKGLEPSSNQRTLDKSNNPSSSNDAQVKNQMIRR